MEIDSRFPTIQGSQFVNSGVGASSTPSEAESARASEFYISPVLSFDSRSLTVIFKVRDSHSGDVVRQFPPETVVERYRQDPTAKPFVLPTSGGKDDDAGEPALATSAGASAGEPGGAPQPVGLPAATGQDKASEPASSNPVNLVA